MCIYLHSLGVLCLRAPIRLHHLHSSLQNNVHKGACCTFWFQPEEPSSLPRASVTSWYPWAEIPLQPHPELRTQGLPGWAKLGWRKLWDSHVQEFGTSSPKPWNHLRLGKVLLPFSWVELGMSGVCRIQPKGALFSWFLNGFRGREEFYQGGLRSSTVPKKFWACSPWIVISLLWCSPIHSTTWGCFQQGMCLEKTHFHLTKSLLAYSLIFREEMREKSCTFRQCMRKLWNHSPPRQNQILTFFLSTVFTHGMSCAVYS